jgi:hypothetical protein
MMAIMTGRGAVICKDWRVADAVDESAGQMAWRQQRVWSLTADALKARLTTARLSALVLTIAGAVLATVAGQVGPGGPAVGKWLAAVAAMAVGVAPFTLRGASSKAVQKWSRARAASEAVKAEIYTYMAGVGHYRGPDRDTQLGDRVHSLTQEVTDLLRYTRPISADTWKPGPIHDVSTYVEHRVSRQSQWYGDKARALERRRRIVQGVGLALSIIVVVLGAVSLKAGVGRATAWVPTTATVAAAVAAYAAWARYEYQLNAYLRTADALDWAVTRREQLKPTDAAADDDFVAECERIISDENKDWVTEWARPESGS